MDLHSSIRSFMLIVGRHSVVQTSLTVPLSRRFVVRVETKLMLVASATLAETSYSEIVASVIVNNGSLIDLKPFSGPSRCKRPLHTPYISRLSRLCHRVLSSSRPWNRSSREPPTAKNGRRDGPWQSTSGTTTSADQLLSGNGSGARRRQIYR